MLALPGGGIILTTDSPDPRDDTMTASRRWLVRSLVALAALTFVGTAGAHYLFVAITEEDGKAVGNVYFEEGPWARDGGYLDPFIKDGKSWARTVDEPKPKPVEMKEVKEDKKRWLAGPLSVKAPRAFESTGTFGTYTYGKTEVLLHYYAKFIEVKAHEDLHELARAEHLKLDIVPHDEGDKLELTLLWKGEPAPDCRFYIRGPKKLVKNTKTDEKGRVTVKTSNPGRYIFRAYVELDEAGKHDGKPYELIRHHSSLVMDLPLEK